MKLILALFYLFTFSFHAITGEPYPPLYAPIVTFCLVLNFLIDYIFDK